MYNVCSSAVDDVIAAAVTVRHKGDFLCLVLANARDDRRDGAFHFDSCHFLPS